MLKDENTRLRVLAEHDWLTGLYNRRAAEAHVDEALLKNGGGMLLVLDIDHFKQVNDRYGHLIGDALLCEAARTLRDIFFPRDIIGRVGGDEFMVFLKGISTEENILKEAAKVETFFKGFQAGEYVKYKATASIGVAIYPQEGADFETLYKAADQGLYKAKKRGKNQLAFYRERTPEGADPDAVTEASAENKAQS